MSKPAAENVKFFYSGLPPWARGVVIVGAFLVVVYVGYTIKNELTDAANARAQNAAAAAAAGDLAGLKQQGIVPSFDSSQYESWSQAIVQAIGGCIGDSSAVLAIFQQLSNQADVLQLIVTFGIRPVDPCSLSQFGTWVKSFWNSNAFSGSLPYMIQWGLSNSDKTMLNQALTAKGITYQF